MTQEHTHRHTELSGGYRWGTGRREGPRVNSHGRVRENNMLVLSRRMVCKELKSTCKCKTDLIL